MHSATPHCSLGSLLAAHGLMALLNHADATVHFQDRLLHSSNIFDALLLLASPRMASAARAPTMISAIRSLGETLPVCRFGITRMMTAVAR
jgi:hypothetical protein